MNFTNNITINFGVLIPSAVLNLYDIFIVIISISTFILCIVFKNYAPINSRGIVPLIHCIATAHVHIVIIPFSYLLYLAGVKYDLGYSLGAPYFMMVPQAISYFAIAIQIFSFFILMSMNNMKFLLGTKESNSSKYEKWLKFLKYVLSWWTVLILIIIFTIIDYCTITIIWGILEFKLEYSFNSYAYYTQLVIYLILLILVFLFLLYDIFSNIYSWIKHTNNVMDPMYFRIEYWIAGMLLIVIGIPYIITYFICVFILDTNSLNYFNVVANFIAQSIDFIAYF